MDTSRNSENELNPKKPIFPGIHYTWVGPPPLNKKTGGIPGHDVTGPIKMAQSNTGNPIFFWCLKEHVDFYKQKFYEYPNITVNSIEGHIEETINNSSGNVAHKASATKIKAFIETLLDKTNRDTIRDRVTIKDAFTFFILQSIGGYVLDTNILPSDEAKKTLVLPSYPQFYVPLITEKDDFSSDILGKVGCLPRKKPSQRTQVVPSLDCWMMFSPKNDPMANRIMIDYLSRLDKAESHRNEVSLQDYYDSLGDVTMIPIEEAKNELKKWYCSYSTYSSTFVDIPELGLKKAYFNTHKHRSHNLYNPLDKSLAQNTEKKEEKEENSNDQAFDIIFSLASAGDTTFLNLLLTQDKDRAHKIIKIESDEEKVFFDDSGTSVFNGETPLHSAVRKGRVDCVNLLINAGADLEAEASYPEPFGKTSVRMLMEKPGPNHKEYLKILQEHDQMRSAKTNPVIIDFLTSSSGVNEEKREVSEFSELSSNVQVALKIPNDTKPKISDVQTEKASEKNFETAPPSQTSRNNSVKEAEVTNEHVRDEPQKDPKNKPGGPHFRRPGLG